MDKYKRIAALVAAILLVLVTIAGSVVAEIALCKHNLWFVAVMYLFIFCYAVQPIGNTIERLWHYFLPEKNESN